MGDDFVETPPMSTHAVSFVVNGFVRLTSGGLGGDSVVNVFASDEHSDQIQYISGEAPELLKFMENFTGIRFDLPKLDLFAVPDFKSDAMGNWGLNTFRCEVNY